MAMGRRRFLATALAGAGFSVMGAGRALAQPADPALAGVHPELRELAVQLLPYTRNMPQPGLATLEQTRSGATAMAGAPLADVPYERREIPGAPGHPDVVIYVINAKPEGARPAILYTHGGGFIAGSAAASLAGIQNVCKTLDCAAVSVEYRLAPETTYRGSIEDNYAGLKWLHQNAGSLGVDANRIAVMGESAGGGHAALLAIAARDRGEVPVAFQCLVYPMLDDRTGSTRQQPPHIGNLVWTAASNRFGWESFLGVPPGRRSAPEGAVPARVESLAGLPPAFIGVGTLDLFCIEDIEYARRLNNAGVTAELIVVPGAFHGFDVLPFPSNVADEFNAAKLRALRLGLGIA